MNNKKDNFNAFILQHFVPFSGKQNVIEWLDETESKFNQLKVPRKVRFQAIPLLIEGDAERKYIGSRNEIRTFDDFHEFLLLQFDINGSFSSEPKSHQTVTNNLSDEEFLYQNISADNLKEMYIESSNIISSEHETSPPRSNTIVGFSATNTIGETPDEKSMIVISDHPKVVLDQAINDLRNTIVKHSIKNPKTLKGSKDNKKKRSQ